jgi:hypothetical protein
MIICGIDIGNDSGVSIIKFEGDSVNIKLTNLSYLENYLPISEKAFIIFEKIFISPKMGRQSGIKFGMNKQKVLSAIKNEFYFEVHPKCWQQFLYNYYKDKKEYSKYRSIKESFDKTLSLMNMKLEGTENDTKRAALLIGIYGTYYILNTALIEGKLNQKEIKFLDDNVENLALIKYRIGSIIRKISEEDK